MKLNVKALGLALGIIWGGAAFIIGLWATMYGPAAVLVNFMGDFYLGYAPGFLGAIIGFFWGFVDAGIGGVIIAWLYNLLSDKFAS